MDLDSKKIFKTLNPRKIWIPVAIGLAIVFYMFYSDPTVSADNLRLLFDADIGYFTLAWLLIIARGAGYIYRIREISNKQLSWVACIYVIILWEFASAVTPSVVGGTAVAVFILLKEGINLGKSLAFVMLTAIMDNMFFVIAAPLAIMFNPETVFPDIKNLSLAGGESLQYLFYISYSLIALYTLIMAYALFAKPRAFKWILLKLTTLNFLRKWRQSANEQGNEIILASQQIRGKGFTYWLKIVLSTTFIWTIRYLQLNVLMSSFVGISFSEHFLIFARQIVLWIIMLISPTPGSSGTAEFFFPAFFEQFLGNYTLISNILWTMMSFYPYLLLGAIFLPRWIRRAFFISKKAKN